ncbi:MAG: toxin [Symploca sp. SIO2C1]|nr:toxin [Symploca sp. SIO2C1]
MKRFQWNEDKNNSLKAQEDRQISFEEIIEAIEIGNLLDIIKHPNQEKYPDQKIFIVQAKAYVYCVPFVEDESTIFLKTIIPSRKMKKKYLGS